MASKTNPSRKHPAAIDEGHFKSMAKFGIASVNASVSAGKFW